MSDIKVSYWQLLVKQMMLLTGHKIHFVHLFDSTAPGQKPGFFFLPQYAHISKICVGAFLFPSADSCSYTSIFSFFKSVICIVILLPQRWVLLNDCYFALLHDFDWTGFVAPYRQWKYIATTPFADVSRSMFE